MYGISQAQICKIFENEIFNPNTGLTNFELAKICVLTALWITSKYYWRRKVQNSLGENYQPSFV